MWLIIQCVKKEAQLHPGTKTTTFTQRLCQSPNQDQVENIFPPWFHHILVPVDMHWLPARRGLQMELFHALSCLSYAVGTSCLFSRVLRVSTSHDSQSGQSCEGSVLVTRHGISDSWGSWISGPHLSPLGYLSFYSNPWLIAEMPSLCWFLNSGPNSGPSVRILHPWSQPKGRLKIFGEKKIPELPKAKAKLWNWCTGPRKLIPYRHFGHND